MSSVNIVKRHPHKNSLINIKRRRVGAKQFPRSLKWLLGAVTGALALSAAYTLVTSVGSSPPAASATILPHGSIAELTEPERFMSAYLLVNCNDELLEKIQSIRITGSIEGTGDSQSFNLIKKRPHFMRFKLIREATQMTVGFDGETVWQRLSLKGQEAQVTHLTGSAAEPWFDQGRFFDRIISAHLGHGKILSIEASEFEDQACLKILTDVGKGAQVSILVDPATMYVLAEERTLEDGRVQKKIASDYRLVEGMPFPFKSETYIGGTLQNRIVIRSAEMNIGSVPYFFEVPASLNRSDSP